MSEIVVFLKTLSDGLVSAPVNTAEHPRNAPLLDTLRLYIPIEKPNQTNQFSTLANTRMRLVRIPQHFRITA